ncbi:MAG: hypothetical protein JW751_01505 [Polyangiaceae bacterium]|nr:hypothetical protein [Polyangiaceae bacterium]
MHHFLYIAGSQPDQFWSPGSAGCLPNGELTMAVTVDHHEDTHVPYFYTYFPEMRCNPNCASYLGEQAVLDLCAECADIGLPTCDVQPQCCWGNEFEANGAAAFPVGEWFCFEMMQQANTPGEHDGSMAYWINGTLGHQVDGMMWRTIPELALNRVGLQHYIETEDAASHSNQVWFDDVVVSTERIGCD